ncbi:MAG: prenyltransferase/squalene oxidase repeat-containing protein [Candidatus Faecousia sp.]|nr:prenyltransferase/squalene oxidase repeat-containing protein [Candidatus Faecousia sp.]
MKRTVLCVLLIVALVLPVGALTGEETARALAGLLDTGPAGLLSALTPGDALSDWAAILAGRAGETRGAEAYLSGLWDYVSRQYQEIGGLDPLQATEWHRVALAVTALGADPTCFGLDARGEPIDLVADGVYAWQTTESLGAQGLNGWIFALLLLDAGGWEPPETARYTRQHILRAILEAQEPDGGFGLTAGASDVDLTAMALQALAPYREDCPEAVQGALDYLSRAQTARGDFLAWGTGSAESCAQVVIALCALGIDPRLDPRFVKAGGSALDGLLLYRREDGAFCHSLEDEAGFLATEQAGLALCALERMDGGGARLYDFTDVPLQAFQPKKGGSGYLLWAAALLPVAGIVIILVRKGRKAWTG